uniref:non-specific serine/threonine protein kinase n=1 Tax=Neogobius melanostomus TaxID=47308 RepID=A0A8C6WFN4_9GOBI
MRTKEKNMNVFVSPTAEPLVRQVKKTRIKREDFDILKVIGRGAFSEVRLARMRSTQQVYALKIMNKWDMLQRGEVRMEKINISMSLNCNKFNLFLCQYLVMDYYVGGDLLTLLSKFGDHLPEDMAQFYLAEMVLAIDSVHRLGYVHRDIKPDNILLTADGHIRLGDFGSCLKHSHKTQTLRDIREHTQERDLSAVQPVRNSNTFLLNTVIIVIRLCQIHSTVAVGTPDYLSPEILRCDWWALGVCAYEMLLGCTPFYAESVTETYAKIVHFQVRTQAFPSSGPEVSDKAHSFITRLICEHDVRLGKRGVSDFRSHPFFSGVDWTVLHKVPAPYEPDVTNATDTSNFDIVDDCLSEMVRSFSQILYNGLTAVPLGNLMPDRHERTGSGPKKCPGFNKLFWDSAVGLRAQRMRSARIHGAHIVKE